MLDNPEAIDKLKDSLYKLIAESASDGLQIASIRLILSDAADNLELPEYCEKWLETFTISPENITGSLE